MAITQVITAIPEAGHRGIDSRDTFVAKQEAFQDVLFNNTSTELNTLVDQINATTTDINLKHDEVIDARVDTLAARDEVVGAAGALPDSIVNDLIINDTDTWSSSKISNAIINSTTLNGITELNISANHVLNSIKSTTYYVNASVPFLEITLPDVTTIANGTIIRFRKHASSSSFIIRDNSGCLIVSVASNQGDALLTLVDNSTSAGLWTVGSIGTSTADISNSFTNTSSVVSYGNSGISNIDYTGVDGEVVALSYAGSNGVLAHVVTESNSVCTSGNPEFIGIHSTIHESVFFDVGTSTVCISTNSLGGLSAYTTDSAGVITGTHRFSTLSIISMGIVKLSDTRALLIANRYLVLLDITDLSNIVVLNILYDTNIGYPKIASSDSTSAVITYSNSSVSSYIHASVVSIAGDVISIIGGAVKVCDYTISSASSLCYMDTGVYILSYIGASSYVTSVVISVNGLGEITIGTPLVVNGVAVSINISSVKNSTTQMLLSYTESTTIFTRIITISGTTLTAGTALSTDTSITAVKANLTIIDTNKFVIAYYKSSAINFKVGTISGTNITVGAVATTNTTPTSGDYVGHIFVNSTTSIRFFGVPNATPYNKTIGACTISGTTIVVTSHLVQWYTADPTAHEFFDITYTQSNDQVLAVTTSVGLYPVITLLKKTGTSLNKISSTLINTAIVTGKYQALVQLSDTKYLLAFPSSSNVTSVVIDTASDVLSVGTVANLSVQAPTSVTACKVDADRAAIVYNSSTQVQAVIVSISGTTITYGTTQVLKTTSSEANYCFNYSENIYTVYGGSTFRPIAISGTDITLGTETVYGSTTATAGVRLKLISDGVYLRTAHNSIEANTIIVTFNGVSLASLVTYGLPYKNNYKYGMFINSVTNGVSVSYKETTTWI